MAAGDGALAGMALHKELRRFPLSVEEVEAGRADAREAPTVPDGVRERAAAVDAAESFPGLVRPAERD